MKNNELTKDNIRQPLDIKGKTNFYIIAEAQGLNKAYAWRKATDRFLNHNADEKLFRMMELALRSMLEKQKGRSLSFEPITFYCARQRDHAEINTIEDMFGHCDIVRLGERIQF